MKEKYTTYTLNKLPKGKTDWKKVKKMTEAEINKAALSDPDARPLSKKELAKFKRVHPPKKVDVKKIREKLHLSQAIFAAVFGISEKTVRDWEQHRRHPTGPARILLAVIAYKPKVVQEALMQ
jgi:putative transcriptional regulator